MKGDDDVMVDLNYITHKQVGRKRRKVFAAKILYQSQLTALKEKGKRLLMCEMVDRESRKQAKAYLGTVEDGGKAQQDEEAAFKSAISDADKKSFMDNKSQIENAFGKSAVLYQEENITRLRTLLVKELLNRKTFNQRNHYIDNKIQFD